MYLTQGLTNSKHSFWYWPSHPQLQQHSPQLKT